MSASKRCVICLNYLKSKKKQILKHSLEDQTLIMYFLRKLAWTPIPIDDLKTFLKVGNPSEWASFCYICEEEVKKCYDMHRKIIGIIDEITDIRKKLYQEYFYESEDEDEEDTGYGRRGAAMDVFNKLREQLFSDFKGKGEDDSCTFDNSIMITYKTSNVEPATPGLKVVIVKNEAVHEDEGQDSETIDNGSYSEEDDNNHSDSESEAEVTSNTESYANVADGTEAVDAVPTSSSTNVDAELDEILKDKSSKDCPRCGNSFHSHAGLRRHFKGVHLQARDVKCPICSKGYARKEYIVSHIHLSHPERIGELEKFGLRTSKKEYKCPHCPYKKFGVSRMLTKHINNYHSHDRERFPCGVCGKTYKNKRNLRGHQKEIHEAGPNRKTWRCSRCGRECMSKAILKRHIREKHDKIRDFSCPHCPKTCARKPDLQKHISKVHGNDGDFPKDFQRASLRLKDCVQCNLCWKSYASPDALAKHKADNHPEDGIEEGESELQQQDEDSLSQEEFQSEEVQEQFQSEVLESMAINGEPLLQPREGEIRQLSLLEL